MFWETALTQDRIAAYVAAGYWRDHLLWDYFCRTVEKNPQKLAVVDSVTRLTYGDLHVLARRCALGLLRLDVRTGDVVTVQLPNRCEHTILTLATELIGAVLNPVPTILRRRELEIIVRIARSKVLVVQRRHRSFDHAELALQIQAASPQLEQLVLLGEEAVPGFMPWTDLIGEQIREGSDQRLFACLRPNANQVTLLTFTSGTTGLPKGVMHTHNTLFSNVEAVSNARDYEDSLIIQMVYQLGHLAGHLWGVRLPLQVGGTLVLRSDYNPDDTLRTIEAERVSMLWGPDVMLLEILSSASFRPEAFKSVRLVSALGESLTRSWAEKALIHTTLVSSFGMTETGLATTTGPRATRREILETDGSALPGVELRVVDNDGADLPPTISGRLLIRSPHNFVGYCQGRAFTHRYLSDDGWFDTEDIATVDHEGFLKWKGRQKDVIRRGGINVPAREIEDLLRQHPAIEDVAVVAVADERLGERACACVILRTGTTFTLSDVKEMLEQRGVTKQYWPEHVEIFDDLPRSVLGRIAKAQLRILAEQRLRSPDPS